MIKRMLALSGFMLVLSLLLAQIALAQIPRVAEPAVSLEHDRFTANEVAATLLSHTSDITFTPVVTLYLPAVSQNYAPCTTVPTLLSPANGAALNTLIPLFRWDSGNDPYATEFNYEASKDTTFNSTYGFSSAYDAQGIHEHQLIWKNLMDWKDDEGKPFIKQMIEQSLQGAGHFVYKFNKRMRVVYLESVEKGDKKYIISSGFYK